VGERRLRGILFNSLLVDVIKSRIKKIRFDSADKVKYLPINCFPSITK
jgi:hypothetical protein